MSRQYPFQVVEATPKATNLTVNTSGQQIARGISQLLQAAAGAANTLYGVAEQRNNEQARYLAAQAKLAVAADEAKHRLGVAEAQTETLRIDQATSNYKQLVDMERDDIYAIVNNNSVEDLSKMMKHNNAGIVDPENIIRFQRAVGVKVAMEDSTQAVVTLKESPDVPLSDVVAELIKARSFPNDQARAAYVETLTNDMMRYKTSMVLQQQEEMRKLATENLQASFLRQTAFDVGEGKLSPESFMTNVLKYQSEYKALNKYASEMDVTSATIRMLDAATSPTLAVGEPGTLLKLVEPFVELYKNDPMYGVFVANIQERLSLRIGQMQSSNYSSYKAQLPLIEDKASMDSYVLAVEAAAMQGQINTTQQNELRDEVLKHAEKLQLNIDVKNRFNRNENSVNPITPKHDKAINEEAKLLQSTNGWTFAQTIVETLGSQSRISKDQIDELNALASERVDENNPQTAIALQTGIETFMAIKDKDPSFLRGLIEGGSLSAKAQLIGEAAYYMDRNATPLFRDIQKVTDKDIHEASLILQGRTSDGNYTMKTSNPKALAKKIGSVSDVDALIKEEYSGFWTANDLDQRHTSANQAFKAGFKIAYAKLRAENPDTPAEMLIPQANEQGLRVVNQQYEKVSMNTATWPNFDAWLVARKDTYLVKKSLVPFDMNMKNPETVARMEYLMDKYEKERNALYEKYEDQFNSRYDIKPNFDDSREVTEGDRRYWEVPLDNGSMSFLVNGQRPTVRIPVDIVEMKQEKAAFEKSVKEEAKARSDRFTNTTSRFRPRM